MTGRLTVARLDLLAESLAYGLIRHYDIVRPPVPIFEMVRRPPAGLERHLSLCLALPYSDAIYLRLLNGQGTIFVNPRLSQAHQRYATARAMLLGLANSPGGHALGLGVTPVSFPDEATEYFARCLLMPTSLLPANWQALPDSELAQIFDVPPEVVAARIDDLDGHGPHPTHRLNTV
jgi:hypothetical protein